MKRFDGVVTAYVKDVDDPNGEGKVKLTYPWLSEDYESNWVPIAVPMAGKERGHWFSPEVDDEVLVAFEHGDFDHPFVVGFLWNGVDKPPDEANDRSVRRIKTVAGHIIEFDDRSGKEKILLKSKAGHYLEIDDPSNTITVQGQSGSNQIVIKDTEGSITAKVPTATVTLNSSGVSIETASGTVSISCTTADVKATGSATVMAGGSATVTASGSLTVTAASMTFNAGIATFTGVVQATTLIASSAVVSPSYTPGVGNLL